MKVLRLVFGIALTASFFSCENEVEINADFQEKTYVLGLLSAQSDTNFVKITKTFLDDNTSAIQLAQDPNNLYYDTLDVTLNELNNENNVVAQFKLQKSLRIKDDGLFTTERNEVYCTNEPLKQGSVYVLAIDKLDGSPITSGEARITSGVTIQRPRNVNKLTFVDIRRSITNYRFEFETTENVGDFTASMVFNYIEINNIDSIRDSIAIPIASFTNPSLGVKVESFVFEGQRFFDALVANIPASNNPPKRLLIDNGVDIIVEAADANYTLYRDVNGPIDGLAQVRPEFTNINNGLGLFASRSRLVTGVSLNDDTKNYIYELYGDRDNLSQFRGFVAE